MKFYNLTSLLMISKIAYARCHDVHRRINVSAGQSIADEVFATKQSRDNQDTIGKKRGKGEGGTSGRYDDRLKFKLQGHKANGRGNLFEATGGGNMFEVNVMEGSPAVTSATSISLNGRK